MKMSASFDSDAWDNISQSSFDISAAIALAQHLRNDLLPHTNDRLWRLKRYTNCFTATHAISWALKNINNDELIAINRLNQLVEYGLLIHVVDPTKKIRMGDNRTLYFRIVDDEQMPKMAETNNRVLSAPRHLMAGNFRSVSNISGGINHQQQIVDIDALQQQIHNLDHILQQTVTESNETHGKLEVMHQEVKCLISQQICTFILLFLLYAMVIVYIIPMEKMSWVTTLAIIATMIISTRNGYRCVSLWSDIDSRNILPVESIDMTTVEESSIRTRSDSFSVEGTYVNRTNSKSFGQATTKLSLSSALFNSIRSVTGSREKKRISERPMTVMREAYTLPDVNTWEHKPLFICANTPVVPNLAPDYGSGSLPIGVPFKFSSDLFEGTCLFRIKGSKSDDIEGDKYFDGRKRLYQSVIQGRFKEEVLISDVMTGHEFARPLNNLPHPFILKAATNFIGKIALGSNIVVHTDQPFMEATLLGTSQVVRGDEPGNEPNICNRDIEEDCSVFGGAFAKDNNIVSIARRKRIFSNPAKWQGYKFDIDTVYTFEFFQNLFDVSSYSLDLGFAKLGASRILNGQPIQWLAKMRDGRYLWVSHDLFDY